MKKLVDSFNYAIEGLLHCVRTERNMRIHFVIAALVLLLAGIMDVSVLETIILLLLIAMVITAELINTAIEAVVDLVCDTYHELAAIAKNVAAGAVLFSSIISVVVGYLIFYNKLEDITFNVTYDIEHMPVHVTIISLAVVTIVVIIVKAFGRRGTFLRGGMPSGHSALATSLLVSIILLSNDLVIGFLAGILTLIAMHSRLEAKIHTLWEVVAGAVLGLLLTLLIFQIVIGATL
jgi:diacylglycerol kinase (ATP)